MQKQRYLVWPAAGLAVGQLQLARPCPDLGTDCLCLGCGRLLLLEKSHTAHTCHPLVPVLHLTTMFIRNVYITLSLFHSTWLCRCCELTAVNPAEANCVHRRGAWPCKDQPAFPNLSNRGDAVGCRSCLSLLPHTSPWLEEWSVVSIVSKS